jgi:flagellin-like protein
MRIKSLMKNKKAFSAIIAALILMLIAVAAGVVVYAYVMGWIGGVQTNPPVSGIITIEHTLTSKMEPIHTVLLY